MKRRTREFIPTLENLSDALDFDDDLTHFDQYLKDLAGKTKKILKAFVKSGPAPQKIKIPRRLIRTGPEDDILMRRVSERIAAIRKEVSIERKFLSTEENRSLMKQRIDADRAWDALQIFKGVKLLPRLWQQGEDEAQRQDQAVGPSLSSHLNEIQEAEPEPWVQRAMKLAFIIGSLSRRMKIRPFELYARAGVKNASETREQRRGKTQKRDAEIIAIYKNSKAEAPGAKRFTLCRRIAADRGVSAKTIENALRRNNIQ